jgi:peptidoglycan/LPS O-acetylase OafA/YrhL
MLREVALIRLDSIYYGFIAVYISRKAPEFWKNYRIPTFILGLIGVVLLMKFENNLMEYNPSHLNNTIFFSLLSISIALLLPYLSLLNEIKFTWIAKVVTGVSIISYSLYLINGGLLAIQFDLLSNKGADWSLGTAAMMYVFYWILCLVLSTLLYVFFEKPFTKLRDKF